MTNTSNFDIGPSFCLCAKKMAKVLDLGECFYTNISVLYVGLLYTGNLKVKRPDRFTKLIYKVVI